VRVVWSKRGLDALLALLPDEAALIDRAVIDWSTTGTGVVHAAEAGAFYLYIDEFVVTFFLDDALGVMHVDGAALHAELEASIAEAASGQLVDADVVLAELARR
jgi:hypothetical protein